MLTEAGIETHRVIKQAPNIRAALLSKFQQGLHPPFGWLGKEGKEASFVVVHCTIFSHYRPAINNVPVPRPAELCRVSLLAATSISAVRRELAGRSRPLADTTVVRLLESSPDVRHLAWRSVQAFGARLESAGRSNR